MAALCLACALVILGIFLTDAVATIRADRASRRRVWAELDRTIEDRSHLAGAP